MPQHVRIHLDWRHETNTNALRNNESDIKERRDIKYHRFIRFSEGFAPSSYYNSAQLFLTQD